MAGMYGVSAYQQTNKSWEAKNIKPVAGHASDNSQKVSAKNDILQISKEGYAMQKQQKLSASSGKDELGISLGDKEGEYIIHFSDSAMVNRTVSRGHLTVNGKKLELSDNQKEALSMADKEAEKKRIAAYQQYVMEHEAAVARQQAEALSHAFDSTNDPLMKLLDSSDDAEKKRTKEDMLYGVEWSDFKWETFETQMKVMPGEENVIGTVSVESRLIQGGIDHDHDQRF